MSGGEDLVPKERRLTSKEKRCAKDRKRSHKKKKEVRDDDANGSSRSVGGISRGRAKHHGMVTAVEPMSTPMVIDKTLCEYVIPST